MSFSKAFTRYPPWRYASNDTFSAEKGRSRTVPLAPNAHRLCYLIPHAEPGGGERMIVDLARRLDRRRFQPFVILPKEGRLLALFQKAGVEARVLPFSRSLVAGYPPAFSWRALHRLTKQLKDWRIDLLHLNDSYLTLLGGLAARSAGIPAVLTAHGVWDAHFLLQDVLNRWLVRKIWAATEEIQQALVRRRTVQKEKVKRVYFGVDTERFCAVEEARRTEIRHQLGIAPGELLVTRIARFDRVKDYPTFLRAMEKLVAFEHPLKIFVVGDVLLDIPAEKTAYKQEAMAWVDRRPELKKRLYFLGYREDIPDLLKATDILVSSSRSESVGLTLLEAMASGVPVVSTWVGGPSEIVLDGETGFLVPPGNAEAIAERVLKLARNPELCAQMGHVGRARAKKYFSLDRFVEDMEAEYLSLLE